MSITGVVNPEPVKSVEDSDHLDERYRQLARSVGCIRAGSTAFGTGWVIKAADQLRVITNAHVVNGIDAARQLGDALIDFGYGSAHPQRYRLVNPRWDKDEHPDVALFEVAEPDEQLPPAIPWRGVIKTGPVVLIGYPLRKFDSAGEIPAEYQAAYQSLVDNLYKKVFSSGKIVTSDPDEFWHTCNTFNGCSGSVILAEIGGQVVAVGLHECGEWSGVDQRCDSPGPVAANRAISLSSHLLDI